MQVERDWIPFIFFKFFFIPFIIEESDSNVSARQNSICEADGLGDLRNLQLHLEYSTVEPPRSTFVLDIF